MEAIVAVNYRQVVLTQKDMKSLAPALTSWRTVYPMIKDLPDSNDSLKRLAKMVAAEMKTPSPRAQILCRLHMRINAMRQRMEVAQLTEAAKR